MRPRYLELEGLQSFKDAQVIDFDKLGETGLFGIFGPTGSGKSTILDAITLALYGNVQRASRGTQGIANTGMNAVRVSFVFDLLRGGERKTYRVERAYRRKKSSDNSVEIKVARLFEVLESEEVIIADKPGDVNQKIVELIGLQDDDFTRSVVLPQNKFQEFLFMDKARKRDMMERIFYLEDYGRNLTEKLARNLSTIKYKLSGIEGAMSALGEISEVALIEAESTMQKARESRDKIDVELKIAEADFNKAREIWELVTDMNVVMNREKVYLQGTQGYTKKKYIYERAQKAESVLPLLDKYQEAEGNLQETLQQLMGVDVRIPYIIEKSSRARQEQDEFRLEVEVQKPRLMDKKSRLVEAAATICEIKILEEELHKLRDSYKTRKGQLDLRMKEIEAKKVEVEKGESMIFQLRQELENHKIDPDYRQKVAACSKLEEEARKVQSERNNCEARITALYQRLSAMETGLQQLEAGRRLLNKDMEGLKCQIVSSNGKNPGERENLLKEGEHIHRLASLYEALKFIKKEVDGLQAKKHNLYQQIEIQKQELDQVEDNKTRVGAELVKVKAQWDNLRRQKELNTAVELAKQLAKGTPCPVCGSTDHPMPAHVQNSTNENELDCLFIKVQEELDQWEKTLREAEGKVIQRAEVVKHSESQLEQIEKELHEKQEVFTARCSEFPEDMRLMDLQQMEKEIEKRNQTRLQGLKELDTWEKNKVEIEAEINRIQQKVFEQKAEEASRQSEVKVNRENLHQLQEDLQSIDLRFKGLSTEYQSLLQSLSISDAGKELQTLEVKQRRADQLQKDIDDKDHTIKEIRISLDKLEEQRRVLSDELGEVRTQGEIVRVRKEENEKKLGQLAGEGAIESELKKVEDQLNAYENREKEIELRVKALDHEHNAIVSQKQMLDNQKAIYNKVAEQERIRLEEALREKGFSGVEEVQNHRVDVREMERLDAEVNQYEEEGNNILAQKQLLMNKLQGRNLSEEQWNKIRENFEQLKLQKEDLISRFENTRSTYLNYKKNFEQWLVLDRNRLLYSRKKEMLEQIQKLLKGNSFIEYISEERLRYIAKEASETLGVLTKYRYSLELDSENGFVIRDHANGGVHRLVSSLSGGETFLTSLSLALALSSQIQLKGQSPLEFFFLDEGFGTLDEELLNTVIDALERLSSTKKVIGLISHVPELKNRISRRLVVAPPTSDGTGSRVRLEKA